MPNSTLLFPQPPPPSVAIGMGKPQLGGGESFTVTCFTCGMPSSKEWAQKVESCQKTQGKPFYPFLAYMKTPQTGALFNQDDGTAFLCAFCHASVEAQWNHFEKAQIPLKERNYNLNNFVCAVCSVTTYRKRIRALPFQEFPFLGKERPTGSLTLGRHPLAVVCLDCSETLWAQSAEYDRWGLPLEKRHFNWMSRPPPPENSMEATVARLPSGETQLPRCPPIEPIVIRRKEPLLKDILKTGSDGNHQYSSSIPFRGMRSPPRVPPQMQTKLKKTSVPEQQNLQSQMVPIVTVAPMASSTTLTNVITSPYVKESLSLPSSLMAMGGLSKLESLRFTQQTEPRVPNGIPSSLFPSSYGSYNLWGGGGGLDPFPPSPLEPIPPQNPQRQWAWIPPPMANPDFVRYQSYLSSIANTTYANAVESYFSQSHPHPLLQGQDPIPNPMERINSPSYTSAPRMNPSHFKDFPEDGLHSYSQYSHSAPHQPNSHPTHKHGQSHFEMPTRKRSAHSPPYISKIPPLDSSANPKTPSSDFVSTPRLTRHLNPSKGVERNKDYIVSASEIVFDCESVRQRALKNHATGQPPLKKRYDREEGGAMDLSLFSSLPTPYQQLLNSSPSKASLQHESKVSVQTKEGGAEGDEKRQNNFLIANLCSENMSPPGGVNRQKEADIGTRDSVIVSLSQSTDPPKALPSFHTSTLLLSILERGTKAENRTVKEVTRTPEETQNVVVPLLSPAQPSQNYVQGNEAKESEKSPTLSPQPIQSVVGESPQETTEVEFNEEETLDVVEVSFTVQETEEEIFAKSRQNFLVAESERRKKMQLQKQAKEKFLKFFQLVSMHEKSELELKILTSRHERKTLPPLKFRPEEPMKEEPMNEDLEKELLRTAFEDPSLRKSHNDPELLRFMESLEMKPASKAQKYRREENWRILLAERMLRFKRSRALSCEKRPWERMNKISRELIGPLRRRHSIPLVSERRGIKMRTLSLNLPPEPPHPPGPQSTDLLTTVEKQKDIAAGAECMSSRMGMSSQNLEKILKLTRRSRQPVITYPKYIPSYAQTQDRRSEEQPPPTELKKRKDELNSGVPMKNLALTSHQENGLVTDTSVDSLIQRSSAAWKETKEGIERLVKLNCEPRRVPAAAELKKLGKSISSQQTEMKAMVKWLKELSAE